MKDIDFKNIAEAKQHVEFLCKTIPDKIFYLLKENLLSAEGAVSCEQSFVALSITLRKIMQNMISAIDDVVTKKSASNAGVNKIKNFKLDMEKAYEALDKAENLMINSIMYDYFLTSFVDEENKTKH